MQSIIHFRVSTSTSSGTEAQQSIYVAPASSCIRARFLINSASLLAMASATDGMDPFIFSPIIIILFPPLFYKLKESRTFAIILFYHRENRFSIYTYILFWKGVFLHFVGYPFLCFYGSDVKIKRDDFYTVSGSTYTGDLDFSSFQPYIYLDYTVILNTCSFLSVYMACFVRFILNLFLFRPYSSPIFTVDLYT